MKHEYVKPLVESSTEVEKGLRGNSLNSKCLEWYHLVSFFKSSRLFASDILVINDDRSFLCPVLDNLGFNMDSRFLRSASDMKEIIWNKRELTSYISSSSPLFGMDRILISCLSFRVYWESRCCILKNQTYQKHIRLKDKCQFTQNASSQPKCQEKGFNNGVMCT